MATTTFLKESHLASLSLFSGASGVPFSEKLNFQAYGKTVSAESLSLVSEDFPGHPL